MTTTTQDVISFVEAWRANNGVFGDRELSTTELQKFATELQAKRGEISVKSPTPGANVIAYSGQIGGAKGWHVADRLSADSNGKLVYISDVDAGKAISSDDCREAVLIAVGNSESVRDAIFDGSITAEGKRTPYGVGETLSLNDFVSREFMLANSKGNVMTLTPAGRGDSVWRDENQDGVSQAGELSTLASFDIVALNVGDTSHSTVLANGNRIADIGTYVKTSGELGDLGETAQSADVDLAVDSFRSQFSDHLDTSSVANLPDLQGAGQVRSLREAATQNSTLAALLTQFAAAGDRATQMGLIDSLLKEWSSTSPMAATFTGAYAGHALTVNVQGVVTSSAAYQSWADKLTILEHFNGRTFNLVPSGTAAVTVNLWTATQALRQQSYDQLKASVYEGLALQTRLKPYLDAIMLDVSETGVRLDFAAMDAALDARTSADAATGVTDWIEMVRFVGPQFKDAGWPGIDRLNARLNDPANAAAVDAARSALGSSYSAFSTHVDLFIGSSGNDVVSNLGDNDTLLGGLGNDAIIVSGNNNLVDGGAGNDTLTSGYNRDRKRRDRRQQRPRAVCRWHRDGPTRLPPRWQQSGGEHHRHQRQADDRQLVQRFGQSRRTIQHRRRSSAARYPGRGAGPADGRGAGADGELAVMPARRQGGKMFVVTTIA